MKKRILFLLGLLSMIPPRFPLCAQITAQDFSFGSRTYEGTIVVCGMNSNSRRIYNVERSKVRFSPFSTFKIPNSIIALETGIISDIDNIYKWDSQKYPLEDGWPDEWSGEHTMRTAFKFSVVPFFRNIAFQIGNKKMRDFVEKFEYGNMDISSGIDTFWLNGSLKISAEEQVEFLQKFYNGELDIAPASMDAIKDILVRERAADYSLSGKTGGGPIDGERGSALGWYVGYVEKETDDYFFAMNIEGRSFADIQAPRIEITKNILRKLKILE